MTAATIRPSEILIPVGYPNDDPVGGAGQTPSDYDEDSLLTVAQLLEHPTCKGLPVESQRRHLAMWVARQVEVGERMGIGTGARSYATQKRNWENNPKQFSNPDHSYHVDRPGDGVDGAAAVDNIPGTSFSWLPGNVARFGLLVLTGNERHHTQFAETPKGASTYSKDPTKYIAKVVQPMDLPYLGTQSIKAWLKANKPITLEAAPPKPPANPPAQPKPGAPKPTLSVAVPGGSPVITEGAAADRVRWWQRVLNDMAGYFGYGKLAEDGRFGAATTSATKRVQSALGVASDGRVGPQTVKALAQWLGVPNKPTPKPKPTCPLPAASLVEGDSGDGVRSLQKWLASKGWNLTIDGRYGPQTRQTVQQFQKALKSHGLYSKAIDGQFGPATREGGCTLIERGLA